MIFDFKTKFSSHFYSAQDAIISYNNNKCSSIIMPHFLPNTVLAWSLFKLCKPEIYILITSLILYQHNALTKIEIIYYTPKDICLSCTIRRQIAVDGDHVHRPKPYFL